MPVKTDGGERRKLTEKCDVIMHDTDNGMLVVVDNQDSDQYTLKFDFGNSENVSMNVCEGVEVLDLKERKCLLVLPANTAKELANMNIDDMDKGTMSVRYKTNISVKRSGTDQSVIESSTDFGGSGESSSGGSGGKTSSSMTTKSSSSSSSMTTSSSSAKKNEAAPTSSMTTSSSSSFSSTKKNEAPAPAKSTDFPGKSGSSGGSSAVSMSMSGTVQEEKKPEAVKAAADEERKIGKDVFLTIKKNFEGYIVYVNNKSTNPVVVTADFATSTGVDVKASAGAQKKPASNETTFTMRTEENRKLPFCKLIAKDKSKIAECKVLYKADVAEDMSAHAFGDAHAKLKLKADIREKAEAEAKEKYGVGLAGLGGGKPGAGGPAGNNQGATTPGGAMVAGKDLKESLAKLEGDRKITDTLTFVIKASVDGYVTYLESKDEDPFVVTVDFNGCKNLKINPMMGVTNVGGEKFSMTIDAGRKFPFTKMPLLDKADRDWDLKYSFTYKNDNSMRQAQDKMRKARERADAQ